MFVDGRWTSSISGETFTAESPATGETIGEVPNAGREDAQIAIGAANRAADAWASATAFARADAMNRVADAIERQARGARAQAHARPGQADLARRTTRSRSSCSTGATAAEDGKRLEGRLPNSVSPGKKVLLFGRPRGVIGVITPWNWPYTMPAELIAPALASGNTVVWTPASTTAIAAIALAECVVEADLPPGVFNLVTGPGSVVGDEIARNPGTHGVGFIGSTETGRKVAEAAAGKAAVLELGGNGPVVVMDDADLDAAAEATVTACFLCAGQSCTAGERLLVHRGVREEFVAKLARLVTERVVLGDPFDERDDDGAAQQLRRRRKDGRACRRRARARRGARQRRLARRRVPDGALLPGDSAGPASRTTRSSRARRRSVRWRRSSRSTRSSTRSSWTNASPYGLLAAIFTRDLAQAGSGAKAKY